MERVTYVTNTSFQTFLHETQWGDIPSNVQSFTKRCLLDLTGVWIGATTTELSKIICNHAAEQFGAGTKSASIMFDGRNVSPAGAALANGMTIDALDAHDGYKPVKGHVGCHVLPTVTAICEAEGKMDGAEFLSHLLVGYEVGARAGLALHNTVSDYHTSGAWGAVTSAALGSRILKFDEAKTREAIGIGEYHGPRSQMMRCIDYPSMLKDGSGWGAMAGVSAAYLAKNGFTGAPAITVEAEEVAHYWADLGEYWTILDSYFKPYPVCRWAQPATEAAITLVKEHGIKLEDIKEIEVHSFHEACRLATREPQSTEHAQYSLPYPVAAALVFGTLGPNEISGDALRDERVLKLSNAINLVESDDYNETFPEHRHAHVVIELNDGTRLTSARHNAKGDPEDHFTDEEIREKYYWLATPVVGEVKAAKIEKAITGLDGGGLEEYLNLILKP